MSNNLSRRSVFSRLAALTAGAVSVLAARSAKGAVKHMVKTGAPKGYDPTKHKWLMALDIDKCIGCGNCVDACKKENKVPDSMMYFRTWIERYIIKKPAPGSGDLHGEVVVDSPNGGRNGFAPSLIPKDEILQSFFVPKLCNLCEHSPCVQACPVGATFDSPDGVVLVDPNYCVGCGFCIQACPYGCRYMNPVTKTADKCTLCYHRITRELKPACVEVCPTQARVFGDLKNPVEDDPLQNFLKKNRLGSLKPHLGTNPRVVYSGLDKEVR